jgi:hypothetical protein
MESADGRVATVVAARKNALGNSVGPDKIIQRTSAHLPS